jgi:hemoglobin/transferrin/lactoferrin receptor protein
MKFKKTKIATLISILLCGSSIAQTDVNEDGVKSKNELKDIKVDQTEAIPAVKVWGTKVQASSININEEDITIRQADHLSDLLRSIPGVDVGGAHSLNQRINIRGLDDKDLAITIDGAVQNTYMYHHAGNLQIHADILKAVEIEVGTNSVINGGLGGAVRFETKEAKDLLEYGQQFGGRIQGSLADNDSSGASVSLFGQLSDTVDILGYYNYVDRNNYTVGGGKILGTDGFVINDTGEVKGLAGETNDALVKLGWDINPNQRIEFGIENYQDEGDYSYRPDMGLATDTAIAESLGLPLVYPTKFTRDTYTINHELNWGDNSTLKTSVYYNNSDLKRDESGIAAVFEGSPSLIEGNAKNKGFNILGNTSLNLSTLNDLTYGLELIDYQTLYKEDGQNISGEEATNIAVYIQDRISWDNGLSIIPGIRYDKYDVDSTIVDNSFDDITFALALEYQFNKNFMVKFSSTELFKGPELAEVFVGAGISDTPNQDIKAESGINHQLSFTYQAPYGLDFGATFFRTNIDNYIYEYADDNIGDLEINGYELFVNHKNGNLNTLITYASQDSELNAFSNHLEFQGARLDRSIGDNINLSFDYKVPSKNLNFHWNTMFVDKLEAQPDLDELNNPKKSYVVHNVSMKWLPEKRFNGTEITFGIDNVFDKHYASHASRTGDSFHPRFGSLHLTDYEPGRNIKATIAYKF